MAPRTRAAERGSSMLIALVFVTIFSLLVLAVVSFVQVGITSSTALQEHAKVASAADDAVSAAINRFRQGGPCDDYTAPLADGGSGPATVDGQGIMVRCAPLTAATGDTASKPRHALLSLGADPSEGLQVGGTTHVLGSVFSRSTVTSTGTLVVQGGDVSALGDCTGTIVTASALRCANTVPAPPDAADPLDGVDPDFAPLTSVVPQPRTVPTCPASGWLVTLAPGYYDDADALSALTAGACPGAVVWIQPGVSYFDLGFRGGSTQWTVSDPTVDVVAGMPKGWDPTSLTRPMALAVPGACKTTTDPAPVEGVQLVLGGESHLEVDGGHVELCARPSASEQQIALFGQPSDRPSHTLKPTFVGASTGFANPGAALRIGEASLASDPQSALATAALSQTAASAASITVDAFRRTLPAGAVLDSAQLRIAHREAGDVTQVQVSSAYTGSTCGPQVLPPHPAMTEDRIDLRACGLTDPTALSDLAVTYVAALGSGGVTGQDELDGIWLDVAYRAPVIAKPTAATTTDFSGADATLEIGEQPSPATADAHLAAGGLTDASLDFSGLGDPPIPPGSTIDSAILRVVHRDAGDVGAVTLTPGFAGSTCGTAPLEIRPAALAEDVVDLVACGLTDASQLHDLTAQYAVSLTSGGATADESIDGIRLELVYRPPAPRPPTAIVASTGFLTPSDGRSIDGASATAALGGSATTASMTTTSFSGPAVPAGSSIDRAVLHVAHRDEGEVGAVVVSASFTGSMPCGGTVPLHPEAISVDDIDLRACGLTQPSQVATLSVTYGVSAAPGATAATDSLDGAALELTFRPPATHVPATAPTSSGFTTPDAGRAIDGTSADAVFDGLAATSASLTVAAFDRPPLPAGAVIDAAVLHVAHRDDGDVGSVSVEPTFTGSTTCGGALPLHAGAVTVDDIDIKACGFTRPDQLASLQVDYATAEAAPPDMTPGSDHLDGIELDIVFRAPSIRPASGCLLAPYPATPALGACALVHVVDSSGSTRLAVQGSTYAPESPVDITMTGVGDELLTRGIVARTIHLALTPAAGYERPMIGVPPEAVELTAYPDGTREPASASSAEFSAADNARTIDGTTATATLADGGTESASLTLDGFALPNAGVKPDDVVLRVKHRDDGDVQSVSVHIEYADGSTGDFPLTRRATLTEDVIDLGQLTAGQLNDEPTTASGLLSPRVTFTVVLAPGAGHAASEQLDGVAMVVFAAPLIRAQVDFDGPDVAVQSWRVLR